MIKKLFTLILFILAIQSFAQVGVKIIEKSSSNRSIIIDQGLYDEIKLGMKVKFLKQTSTDYPKLDFIGEAEAIKVHDNYSYWYFTKLYNEDLLAKNQKIKMIKMSDVIGSRGEMVIHAKRIVLPQDLSVMDYQENEKIGVPEKMVTGSGKVESSRGLFIKKTDNAKVNLNIFDIWEAGDEKTLDGMMENIESYHLDQVEGMVSTESIRKDLNQKFFDDTVNNTISKTNQLKHGLYSLYQDSPENQDFDHLGDTNIASKVKEQMANKRKSNLSLNVKRRIADEDGRWSENMSDEQLRRYFVDTGIIREHRRRNLALENSISHELLLRFSRSTRDKTSELDDNYRSTGYSLQIGYEYLLGRTFQGIRNFTCEFIYEKGMNYYHMGNGFNVKAQEVIYRAGLNWYFYRPPETVQKYIWYLGSNIGFGTATLDSNKLSRNYHYQLYFLPEVHLGMKYRFSTVDDQNKYVKMGIAANLLVSYEKIKLGSNDELWDNIYGRIVTDDLKFIVGLNFYF